jgi:hypothetical protein
MIATILQATDDGLSFGEILAGIPHDAAAIFTYALLAGAVYVVWRGSRGAKSG